MISQSSCAAGVGRDRQRESQEAVSAHFQHDGRQHHRAAGGRLDVRVGQPGVHRPHRHLHREGGEERQEDERLLGERQRHALKYRKLVAARLQIQVDQRDQHQQRADEGVQEELDGRIHAPRAAPDADDDEHRHAAWLPRTRRTARRRAPRTRRSSALPRSGRPRSTAPRASPRSASSAITISTVVKVVSRISGIEMPSTPM